MASNSRRAQDRFHSTEDLMKVEDCSVSFVKHNFSSLFAILEGGK
jgi:hypothetical protein